MFLQDRVLSVPLGRGLPSYDLGDFFINFGRIWEPTCDGHADVAAKFTKIFFKSIQNRDQRAPKQVLKHLSFLKTSLEGQVLWFWHMFIDFGGICGTKMWSKTMKKQSENQHCLFARILWFLDDFRSHFGVGFYELPSRRQKWPTCVSTAPAWSDRGSDLSKSSQKRARRESKSRLRFAIIFLLILSTCWLNFGDQNGAKMSWKSESKSSSTKKWKKVRKQWLVLKFGASLAVWADLVGKAYAVKMGAVHLGNRKFASEASEVSSGWSSTLCIPLGGGGSLRAFRRAMSREQRGKFPVYSFTPPKHFPIHQNHQQNAPQNPLNCQKMRPKTFKFEQKIKWRDENEKSWKKRGRAWWL